MVWQHKPSGYSLTGTIPCTLSDNISHCVLSTTPLFTPNGAARPSICSFFSFLSPNPCVCSLGGDFLLFFHSRELSDDVMLTRVSIAPNNPANLRAASRYHTFLLQKKKRKKRKKEKKSLTRCTWDLVGETTLSDNADLSPRAVLSAGSGLRKRVISGRQIRRCVADRATLSRGIGHELNIVMTSFGREAFTPPPEGFTEKRSFQLGNHHQRRDESTENLIRCENSWV